MSKKSCSGRGHCGQKCLIKIGSNHEKISGHSQGNLELPSKVGDYELQNNFQVSRMFETFWIRQHGC